MRIKARSAIKKEEDELVKSRGEEKFGEGKEGDEAHKGEEKDGDSGGEGEGKEGEAHEDMFLDDDDDDDDC